jgi:squalene cyclase
VTAYVGRALAEAGARGPWSEAAEAARRAATWLRDVRAQRAGWGYNARSGADVDSTAHALLLLRAVGAPVEPRDVGWLRAHLRGRGGFATYDRRDAWGVAHPDVTPVALLALLPERQEGLAERVRQFILRQRAPDGSWPAYWWRGRQYSTYWNLRALHALGGCEEAAPPGLLGDLRDEALSAFEQSFVLGCARLLGSPERVTHRLTRELLEAQGPEGSWTGAPNLRVTHPDCYRPWEWPDGALYADTCHLMTTASVLSALLES